MQNPNEIVPLPQLQPADSETSTKAAKLVDLYDIGEMISCSQIKRNAYLQNGYIIQTPTERYFLKEYKYFHSYIEEGLLLTKYLRSQNFPALEVLVNQNGQVISRIDQSPYALFDYMDIPPTRTLTPQIATNLGLELGRLHSLTIDYPLYGKNEEREGFEHFYSIFSERYENSRIRHSFQIQEIFDFVQKWYPQIRADHLPTAILHNELTLEHVRFDPQSQEVLKVIDWDEINRDPMVYDLGTTMTAAYQNGLFNLDLLSNIVSGYNSQRNLTEQEKDHLYKALLFGVFKFFVWSLCIDKTENTGLEERPLNQIRELMSIHEEEFNNYINSHL